MLPFQVVPQVVPDTTQTATAYDSVWAHTEAPVQTLSSLDQFMLSHDKLFVVMTVVLIIWFGLVFFVFRTDRKLTHLERMMDERIAKNEGEYPER